MIDLENEGAHLEEAHTKEDEGRQMAQAMGAEKLYDTFQELFPESDPPVDKLQGLFEAAGLMVSQEQIESAITTLHPEVSTSGSVGYKQCQELFIHLQHQRQKADHQDQELVKAGRFTRWIAGLSDKDSTNLLLLVVLTLCCISVFLAGGLAILLLVLDNTQNIHRYLQENLGIVQDSLEVYAQQIAVQQTNDRFTMFVTTMAAVLQNVAFSAGVAANTVQLSRVLISVSNSYSACLNYESRTAFSNLTLMSGQLSSVSLRKYGLNGTAALFNEVNARLPDGYELLLGQWRANSTTAVDYLTKFRYASECPNGTCSMDATSTAPMRAALAGNRSGGWGLDYRGAKVLSGSSTTNGLGVQFNVANTTIVLARHFAEVAHLNSWSLDQSTSWDFILCYVPPGTSELVVATALANCDVACLQQAVADGTPAARAANGESGTMTYMDFRGQKSLAAYTPVLGAPVPMGLAVQMSYNDIVRLTLRAATSLVNNLNRNFPSGTEEFELVQFATQGGTTNFTRLSAYRFADQCPSRQCVPVTDYLQQAAANCSLNVLLSTDYRGQTVVVGYTCIPELGVILTLKMDLSDLDADTLAAIVEAVNYRSSKDMDISSEYLVSKPKPGLIASQVRGYEDFDVVTKLKHPDQCSNPNCTWNRESALRALQNLKDVVDVQDYRGARVMSAATRSTSISYGIGLAVEQDSTEAFQPMITTIIQVAAFTAGMVVASTVVLIAMTKVFLNAMIKAKEEGHRVVETEKERFSKLVSSMYPKFVVPQLLHGDKQLVCEVPGAAVFFSDIHEFTSASNTMGSSELLQLMGYVYGVMDFIGDSFGVYKVKTIGDAYLAVQGLPGSDSENPSLELLRYASFVCQVFGDRFVHPTEGQVLAVMNSAMLWNGGMAGRGGKKKKDRDGAESVARSVTAPSMVHAKAPSMAPSKAASKFSKRSKNSRKSVALSVAEASRQEDNVQCIMSYGLAVGKIVAGVLAGRCPMFDIWGGTVNLASRMQSTGEPGRIQVSEQLYRKVVSEPGQPFTFDLPRSTYCKGFGTVNAYVVRATTEGLPKDLQTELQLEPRYGAFQFDNVLASLGGPGHEGPPPVYTCAPCPVDPEDD
eukprot:EG_transcript_937